MKLAMIVAAIAAVLALAACGSDDGEDSGDRTAGDPAALEGSTWILTGGIDVEDWERVAPSINFERGQLGGSSGCNTYGGSYEATGSTLRISDVFSTAMACPPPAMEVEEAFMANLEAASEWGIEDDELVLGGGGGDELRFLQASVEGSWRVTSFLQGDAVSTLLPGSEITAEFGTEGISGSAGCNEYSAGYRARGSSITIEPAGGTEKACEPPGVMEQEGAFLEALPKAARFRLEGGNLVLLTAKGTILATLEPAPEEDSD